MWSVNRALVLLGLTAAGVLLTSCGSSESDAASESKVEACAEWDAAMQASDEFMAESNDGPALPDTGDPEADLDKALDDMNQRMDELVESKQTAKDAFAQAATEDKEWVDVQEAAYDALSSGSKESEATVEAACDRLP